MDALDLEDASDLMTTINLNKTISRVCYKLRQNIVGIDYSRNIQIHS